MSEEQPERLIDQAIEKQREKARKEIIELMRLERCQEIDTDIKITVQFLNKDGTFEGLTKEDYYMISIWYQVVYGESMNSKKDDELMMKINKLRSDRNE